MAIAIVGAATTASSSGVCPKPAGVVAGNVLIAFTGSYAPAVTAWASSGWTFVTLTNETAGPAGSDMSCGLLYKVAGASEPASYTFTSTGGGASNINVIMAAYSGVDNVTPVDTSSVNNSVGDNINVVGLGLTASQTNELLVFGWFGDDNGLSAAPSGAIGSLTTRVNGTTFLNLDIGFAGYYDGLLSASGATGNYTATLAPSADTWIVIMAALNPAAIGGCAFPAAAMHYVTP